MRSLNVLVPGRVALCLLISHSSGFPFGFPDEDHFSSSIPIRDDIKACLYNPRDVLHFGERIFFVGVSGVKNVLEDYVLQGSMSASQPKVTGNSRCLVRCILYCFLNVYGCDAILGCHSHFGITKVGEVYDGNVCAAGNCEHTEECRPSVQTVPWMSCCSVHAEAAATVLRPAGGCNY